MIKVMETIRQDGLWMYAETGEELGLRSLEAIGPTGVMLSASMDAGLHGIAVIEIDRDGRPGPIYTSASPTGRGDKWLSRQIDSLLTTTRHPNGMLNGYRLVTRDCVVEVSRQRQSY